ncbi:NosD domain-containing protein [Glaciibacter sp. 2TAF33]|uniref:NosD domain-containing protein n=1 Tax=Glaciibacter sp. 2TAF33 TaxID=3233015 RepID=UPI003F935AE9
MDIRPTLRTSLRRTMLNRTALNGTPLNRTARATRRSSSARPNILFPAAVAVAVAGLLIGTMAPLAAAPASAAVSSEASTLAPTIIGAASSDIAYDGAWRSTASTKDQSGAIRFLSSAGSASYTFTGTSVGWVTRLTSSSGISTVSIDGAVVATVDGYAAETAYRQLAYATDTLAPGQHTITVTRTGQKNPASTGTNTIVDAFGVADVAVPTPPATDAPLPVPAPESVPAPEPTPAPEAIEADAAPVDATPVAAAPAGVTVGVYENTSAPVKYSGAWRTMNSGSDSGGSSEYLNSAGSATLTFTGTAVQWLSRVTPSSGIANVYLDGAKTTVDRYSKSTAYQKVVYSRSGLADTTHTLTIEWSGTANPASSGKNVMIDALVVPDVAPPAKPTALAASNASGNVALSWSAGTSPDVASYRVYNVSPAGAYSLIGQTAKTSTSFTVLGVPADSSQSYAVTSVDTAGNESAHSAATAVKTGTTPVGSYRSANCPAATVTVSNAKDLMKAVASAAPGAVIKMADGTYRGQMNLTAKGTATKPIWLCGSRNAIIDGGGITNNQSPIQVNYSSHLIVTGMTATNGLKGVTVRGSDHITISDMLVEGIGFEGIHLRSNTTDSVVVGNTIRKTGLLNSLYGEGVYIGSSDANWCALTNCNPDKSDRNAVVENTISHTTADMVEAKEGTTGGLIRGNSMNGTDAMNHTESWIMVSGNGWSVVDNSGTQSSLNGFRVNGATVGWGFGNLFAGNTGAVDAAGYGFKLYEVNGKDTSGTLVSCGNTMTGAAAGFSNVACTK